MDAAVMPLEQAGVSLRVTGGDALARPAAERHRRGGSNLPRHSQSRASTKAPRQARQGAAAVPRRSWFVKVSLPYKEVTPPLAGGRVGLPLVGP